MDGGHTIGMNQKAIGVLCMGNFDVQHPTNAMIDKLIPHLRVLCGIFNGSRLRTSGGIVTMP